jgi:hypothetical protein
MKAHLFLILILMAVAPMTGWAQGSSASIPPKWLHKLPTPTNSSFQYELQTSMSQSVDNAREKCLNQLVANSGVKNGVVALTESNSNKIFNQKWLNGKLTETNDVTMETHTSLKGSEQKLYVNKVAEYWRYKHGMYTLSVVYAKSELGQTPLFDNVILTDKYGARGFIRSLIIPGWGQMYKGSTVKGAMILGGTAVLAGGIIFTESMRKDYSDKRLRTHDATLIKSYTSKCDNWRAARNITIGAAGALYIYNLMDAIVAPGAQRIVVRNFGRGRSASLYPMPTANGAALSTRIQF